MDSYRSCHTSNSGNCGCFNSPGNHRMTRTDKAFSGCVQVLNWTASKTGLTYEQVNVWVFCVIWPVVTIGLIVAYVLKK